tara:strand:+ start:470 stop:1144 length:675 start_codon:yes stop_codon:yes gene_type:complete
MTPWKKKFFLILIFLIFTTYTPSYLSKDQSLLFSIEEVTISNKLNFEEKKITSQLLTLKGKNLTSITEREIEELLKDIKSIKSVLIKKIYPNEIKLQIEEKKMIARTLISGENFLITKKGELIKQIYSNNNFDIALPELKNYNENFHLFYSELLAINFKMDNIKSFQYFEVGRWDIHLKDGILIKLPEKDFVNSLKNFKKVKSEKKLEKFKIFDFRIKDELILR